jgi:CBS domain-containing protein
MYPRRHRAVVQVADIMSREVQTVDVDATLRECIERMLRNGIGSVVVVSDGDPAGIVTETDVLKATYATDRGPSGLPAKKVMSNPIERIRPTATVRSAVERMRSAGVKKLLVMDGLTMRGIVTLSDVADHLPDVRAEASKLAGTQHDWERSERFW